MAKDKDLERKRAAVARKIKELAPHIETLVMLIDETKIDLVLIALAGATITNISDIG